MRLLLLLSMISASEPVAAQAFSYPACIDTLQEALRSKTSLDAMLDGHYRALFDPAKGAATASARDASAKAKGEVDAALDAYIDSLAVACEALR